MSWGIILTAHEDSYYGQAVLNLLENIELARKERMPLCKIAGWWSSSLIGDKGSFVGSICRNLSMKA